MNVWCPFADYHPIHGHDRNGPMAGGAAKIVHHTTEGDKLAGAEATYEVTGDLPHFTDTYENGVYKVVQHLALDQFATALKHRVGTGETNRDSVVQIEHVGHTATSAAWPDGYLDGIAILCRWIELQTGCVRAAIAPFQPGARRLSWPEWHGTSGHCGHLHVPFNDHTDPGAMDIGRVLTAGQPIPVPNQPAPLVGVVWSMSVKRGTRSYMQYAVNVAIDTEGNGHQQTDFAYPGTIVQNRAIQDPRPPPEGNGRYKIATCAGLDHGGKLDVVVMGADPSLPPPAVPWVVPVLVDVPD